VGQTKDGTVKAATLSLKDHVKPEILTALHICIEKLNCVAIVTLEFAILNQSNNTPFRASPITEPIFVAIFTQSYRPAWVKPSPTPKARSPKQTHFVDSFVSIPLPLIGVQGTSQFGDCPALCMNLINQKCDRRALGASDPRQQTCEELQ